MRLTHAPLGRLFESLFDLGSGGSLVKHLPIVCHANVLLSALRVSERIDVVDWIIPDITVQVEASRKSDRILADKPLELGVVVARPTVPPVASVAGKSPSLPMRVGAMRPSAADAGCGGGVVGSSTREMLRNGVFGHHLDRPRQSAAILEARRPCADGPASE